MVVAMDSWEKDIVVIGSAICIDFVVHVTIALFALFRWVEPLLFRSLKNRIVAFRLIGKKHSSFMEVCGE